MNKATYGLHISRRLCTLSLIGLFLVALPGRCTRTDELADRIDELTNELTTRTGNSAKKLAMQAAVGLSPQVIAEERAAALSELIEADPLRAAALALPEDVRERLGGKYPEVLEQLETHGAWQGPVACITEDDFALRKSRMYCQMRVDGRQLRMHFADLGKAAAASGKVVSVQGLRLGNNVVVTRSRTLEAATGAGVCSTIGEQRVAVLLVNFPGVAQPDLTTDQIREVFFGTTGMSLDSYWREASYGKTFATGNVFGWFTLDKAYESSEADQMRDAAIRAADSAVDFRLYNRVFIVFGPPSTSGWPPGFAGGGCTDLTSPSHGSFAASTAWLNASTLVDRGAGFHVVAHEAGHNLGLGHAGLRQYTGEPLGNVGDPGTVNEYGDPNSVMGTGNGHYDARAKYQLGWLEDGTDIQEVEAEGMYSIVPFEQSAPGIKALRMRRAPGLDAWLWVEYRQPIGIYDSTLYENTYRGALVYYEDLWDPVSTALLDFTPGSSGADAVDAALLAGSSWVDPYTPRSVNIDTAASSFLNVAAVLRPICADLSPARRQHGPGSEIGVVTISAPASCAWNASSSVSWITLTSSISGSGPGSLSYRVDANVGPSSRQGVITIGGAEFRVDQSFANVPPVFSSIDPASGDGLTANMNLLFDDPNGSADIRFVRVNVNSGPGLVGGCVVEYDRSDDTVRLANDAGTGWLVEPKNTSTGLQTLENSRCGLVGVAALGNLPTRVVFNPTLRFKPAFVGATNVYGSTQDYSGLDSGWQPAGQWNIERSTCLSLIPDHREHGGGQETGIITISAPYSCIWTRGSAAPWITNKGTVLAYGPAVVSYSVDANPGLSPRSATIDIGDVPFTVNQGAVATNAGLPGAWATVGIGTPTAGAGAKYLNGVFEVTGAQGALGLGAGPDSVQFLYEPVIGDATFVARIATISGSQANATVGIMLRESVNPLASTFAIFSDSTGSTHYFTWDMGGAHSYVPLGVPQWYKLVRAGNQFSAYVSQDGTLWQQFGTTQTINMAGRIYAGMFVGSNATNLLTAVFDNVFVTGSPDLMISETHGAFTQGQASAAYAITVSNIGTLATDGAVTVTATLQSGLVASAINGGGWSCTLATLTCTRTDELAAEGNYPSITLTLNVASDAPAAVTNTIAVSGGSDPNTANNTMSDVVWLTQPLGLRFIPMSPCRVSDTRRAAGPFGGPMIGGGATKDIAVASGACGIPSNAQAYSLNATVVPPGRLGYLTVWPTGVEKPTASTVNSLDGRITANAAVVPAGTSGSVSVYASDPTHVVLDVDGYFVAASGSDGYAYYQLAPCRILDTRQPAGAPTLSGGGTREVTVRGQCGVPDAAAYSLNVTAVPKTGLGYLTVWPAGSSKPMASTLNAPTGAITANAAIVPAGAGGAIDVYASNDTDLIIDINGYFAAPGPGGLSFYTLQPCRVVETRSRFQFPSPFGADPALNGLITRDFPVLGSGCLSGVSAAQAYSLNATVVPPGPLGYLTLWPTGQTKPTVSTLNALDGRIAANAAIVPADANGAVSAYTSDPTDLVLDINGYFAP